MYSFLLIINDQNWLSGTILWSQNGQANGTDKLPAAVPAPDQYSNHCHHK